jgi:hypothetical protein
VGFEKKSIVKGVDLRGAFVRLISLHTSFHAIANSVAFQSRVDLLDKTFKQQIFPAQLEVLRRVIYRVRASPSLYNEVDTLSLVCASKPQ